MDEEQKQKEIEKVIEKSNKEFNRYILIYGILIAIVCSIITIGMCKSNHDLKYEIKEFRTSESTGTVIAYVENNTSDYVSYTLDVQIHDRYGELVGNEAGTIRLDPHEKKEYLVTINCWSSDLSGAKAELRVF